MASRYVLDGPMPNHRAFMQVAITITLGIVAGILILNPMCRDDTRQWARGVIADLTRFWLRR